MFEYTFTEQIVFSRCVHKMLRKKTDFTLTKNTSSIMFQILRNSSTLVTKINQITNKNFKFFNIFYNDWNSKIKNLKHAEWKCRCCYYFIRSYFIFRIMTNTMLNQNWKLSYWLNINTLILIVYFLFFTVTENFI